MRRERRREARCGNEGEEHRGETWRETKLQTEGERGKNLTPKANQDT